MTLTKRQRFREKVSVAARQVALTEKHAALRQLMTHGRHCPQFQKFDAGSFVKGALWVYDKYFEQEPSK